jgi:hypothetical protein
MAKHRLNGVSRTHGFLSGPETMTVFDTGPMTLTNQRRNWIGAFCLFPLSQGLQGTIL